MIHDIAAEALGYVPSDVKTTVQITADRGATVFAVDAVVLNQRPASNRPGRTERTVGLTCLVQAKDLLAQLPAGPDVTCVVRLDATDYRVTAAHPLVRGPDGPALYRLTLEV